MFCFTIVSLSSKRNSTNAKCESKHEDQTIESFLLGTTRPRPTTTTTTEAPVCPLRYSACKCDRAPRTACSHFEKSVCNTKTGACECEYGFRLSRGECIVDRSVIRETTQKPSSGMYILVDSHMQYLYISMLQSITCNQCRESPPIPHTI